ncbi:pentapeptide repeat-containing protein [Xanthovirga aplysinae]|uniref:pentapeptide repeat-containing protein n=1 Tax=Xanthovirga aplysinae TaxID=2529853 RepID=UPI001FE36367|nr:pentapeptide repeat-containing protein [Xanthovirga aplysinae]
MTSFVVLMVMTVLVVLLSIPFYRENFREFYRDVLIETHGMLFDLLIIGILLYWLNQNGQRLIQIRRYKDEIDDFRLWQSEEAAFRTVGNIKRLNRNNIYSINLVNCFLAKTQLSHVNLSGSNLNNANLSHSKLVECNFEGARLNQTNLENANLNQINMESAYASGANFKDAVMIKANLAKSFLIKANFTNAFLMEANLNDSNLAGVDFENANLYKADLRNAKGLTLEQLEHVKTLYKALLDPEIKQIIKDQKPNLLGK